MTIYEVMKLGEMFVECDDKHELLVTWNYAAALTLWIETDGKFQILETRIFPETLVIGKAREAATKLLLNIKDEAEIVLHDARVAALYTQRS